MTVCLPLRILCVVESSAVCNEIRGRQGKDGMLVEEEVMVGYRVGQVINAMRDEVNEWIEKMEAKAASPNPKQRV